MSMLAQDILPIFHSRFIRENLWGKRQNNWNLDDEASKHREYIRFSNARNTDAQCEIRRFPRFLHEISVPEANATWTTENKHGGQELCEFSKQKQAKYFQIQRIHSTDGENRNIFHTFYAILLKFGRVKGGDP